MRSSHLELPTELVFKILAHVLAYSVHKVVTAPDSEVEWHLNAHTTLASVSFFFREIINGISVKAFQFSSSSSTTQLNLASHVRHHLLALRTLGKIIREPTSAIFSLESLDPLAPPLIQGYSLYIAIVYLRTQAARSTRDIYRSTSVTIFGAVITLSKVLYSRIAPGEVAVMLQAATEDEAELSDVGIGVVKKCALLTELMDTFERTRDNDAQAEEEEEDEDDLPTRVESLITAISSYDSSFLALLNRPSTTLPCCTPLWPAHLPEVLPTLQRLDALVSSSLVSSSIENEKKGIRIRREARERLGALLGRWTPPATSTGS